MGHCQPCNEYWSFNEDISVGKNLNAKLNKDQLDPLIHEIELKVSEMRPIISFLNTLNDEKFDKSEPASVPMVCRREVIFDKGSIT